MTKAWLRHAALILVIFSGVAFAGEEPLQDDINPLLEGAEPELRAEQAITPPPAPGFASFFTDASLGLSSTYYGRARHADNGGRDAPSYQDEIHVNAFGQRADFRSGYAWGVVGFDLSGQTNLGRGNGWSEVLLHKESGVDRSSVSLSQAAVKLKFGGEDFGLDLRGGYTPISIGSLGTSGGLFSHSYRGMEARLRYKRTTLGYGWADRFRNEWDDNYRTMYNRWHQNRFGQSDGVRVTYVHSIGLRHEFENGGFVDLGVGEGRRYRRNMQAAASYPIDLGCWGTLTLTGYGILARYRENYPYEADEDRETEYHVSSSAEWKRGRWTFMGGYGHTRAPNSREMQFRLTAWGNSDNRNFIQTWGQLDDFVWDGQNVAKTGFRYGLGDKVCLPGLSVGASYMYTWGGRNPGRPDKTTGWELDYFAEYAVPEGRLKGLALGVYAGHLRYRNNRFIGKQNRNDVKVILSYSRTLEEFLRTRK